MEKSEVRGSASELARYKVKMKEGVEFNSASTGGQVDDFSGCCRHHSLFVMEMWSPKEGLFNAHIGDFVFVILPPL